MTNQTKYAIIKIQKQKGIDTMKMFNEMSLVSIRKQLVKVGVEMTDEKFYSLTQS